ncbi:TonB dependent receptor [Pseudoflavitalea rhizosphaerae]|uniref:TonB dependent receptor n=1 Tax=Pseudoflavitalea rhizosphaerae TaxID=1884793 RepID=UPI000F8C7636|nr:TonB dependent receptor [Pseudoflavitalea rhizosphaerae]
MNRIKTLVVAASLLLLQMTTRSQTISGMITDEENMPVSFATLHLHHLPDSSIVKELVSDSSGKFSIGPVPAGRYFLRISAIGFTTIDREINLVINAHDLGQLVLPTDPSLLSAVLVTGAPPVFQRQADRLVVTVAGSPFFKTAGNGLDVLRKIPGLEINYDGSLLLSGRITPAVFIDGKPVPMNAIELQQFLQTLTPEMIASIEVVNNPSARFDGEYKGIIDIKLKKDQALGWKGLLSSGLQMNNYMLSDNSLLLTRKTKSTAFTLRGGYTVGSRIYRYEAYQQLANTNFMRTKNGVATRFDNYNFQIGADHQLAKDHRVELSVRTMQNQRQPDAYGTLHTTDATTKELVSITGTTNTSRPVQRSYAASFNYSGKWGNHHLQWLNNYLDIRTRQQENIISSDLMEPALLLHWKTRLRNDMSIRSTQADYRLDAGAGRINAGARFAYSNTYNNSRYDTLDQQNNFLPDESRTNQFRYREYISAGYLSWESTSGRFTYTAGLRVENTNTIADALSNKETTRRNFWHWLPSAGISFEANDKDQWQVNFSRRLTRPIFSELYPFRIYNSPLNYFIGNPYLTPALTTSVNITWTHRRINFAFNIGRESDPLGRYPKYDPATNVLEYLGKNFNYKSFGHFEASLPLELKKWWRISHTVGLYYMKENIPYFDYTFSTPVKYVTINGSQVFTLPGRFTLDLTYFYKSANGNSLYTSRYNSNIDIGVQKSWCNGRVNTKLSVMDILNTYKVVFTFREKQIINNTLSHWPGMRRVAFTLSYNFGKSTYKAKQQNRSEEETRAM